jgi:hypothetical protein
LSGYPTEGVCGGRGGLVVFVVNGGWHRTWIGVPDTKEVARDPQQPLG